MTGRVGPPVAALALGMACAVAAPAMAAGAGLPDGACYLAGPDALSGWQGGAGRSAGGLDHLSLRITRIDDAIFAVVLARLDTGPRARAAGVAGQVFDNSFFCGATGCQGDDDAGGLMFAGPVAQDMRFRTDYLALVRVSPDGADFTHIDLTDWAEPADGVFHLRAAAPGDCEEAP